MEGGEGGWEVLKSKKQNRVRMKAKKKVLKNKKKSSHACGMTGFMCVVSLYSLIDPKNEARNRGNGKTRLHDAARHRRRGDFEGKQRPNDSVSVTKRDSPQRISTVEVSYSGFWPSARIFTGRKK